MTFSIPVMEDDPNDVYFEMNLHRSWMKYIDEECDEYGYDRMNFVRELVKLGLMAWKNKEELLEDEEAVALLGD
tara:strand:+ start:166 stop:387 length:222 start_codon:yes stop_codon:yes gene_type:complete